MSLLTIFSRLMLRPVWKEPVRTALTVIAVALGVAVVLAISLAGESAAGSFQASVETMVGKKDLVITADGGLDEQILGRLDQLPEAFTFTPRIEDFAFVNGRGAAIVFLGLDLLALSNERTMAATGLPPDPHQLWGTRSLGLQVGQRVKLLINESFYDFTVAGIIPAREGEDFLVCDIGIAQQVTGKTGKLDSIDVTTPPGSLQRWTGALRRILPPGVSIEPQGARTAQNRKMLSAFRWNLRVLSYVALLVGAFLIYNSISISVVRRRSEIGIVRALGASRAMVLGAFLLEAAVLGAAGGSLGVVFGRLMAIEAIALVEATVTSLYVSSRPSTFHLSTAAVLTAVALGVCVSVLAAVVPAFEAATVPPVEAMARGRAEFVHTVQFRTVLRWALLALAAAAGLSCLPAIEGQPLFAYLAVVFLIAGICLTIPPSVRRGMRWLPRAFGVEALIAMRSLAASLARTWIITAALTTAIGMTAAIGIMVGSFRQTVAVWLNEELRADFYLRPAGSAAADRHPTMSAGIADAIERIPGVAAVDRFRAYPITYQALPATFAGGQSTAVRRWAPLRLLPGEDASAVLRQLPQGDYAVVSEPFANKHHVRAGDSIQIPLAGIARRFTVLGIYYDYSTERGLVVVDRKTLLRYLPDPASSSLAVYLDPHADAKAVQRFITTVLSGRAVLVFSNAVLRNGALALFDQTFRITYALEAIAIVVAVLGIASSLLAVVIDRRRELGLVRFLGAAGGQVRRIVLWEAGLIAFFASCIGAVLGVLLSLILIFVINKQSFGWTLQFEIPALSIAGMLIGIFVATVAAGIYPARVATRLNPVEVIHEE